MWIIAGLGLQTLGIFALRTAQLASSTRSLRALAAIGILLLAILPFTKALGFELGLTWSLVAISLVAYALILRPLVSADAVGHNRAPKRARRMPVAPSDSRRRLTVRLIAAGPLALIAALALSLIIATKPWAVEITRLFTGGLLAPLFWSLGALHATVDSSLWRVVLLPISTTALAASAYWLL
ncbi:MAG: hypothetical protein AAFO81_03970 [Pseudomonadota bacterium]